MPVPRPNCPAGSRSGAAVKTMPGHESCVAWGQRVGDTGARQHGASKSASSLWSGLSRSPSHGKMGFERPTRHLILKLTSLWHAEAPMPDPPTRRGLRSERRLGKEAVLVMVAERNAKNGYSGMTAVVSISIKACSSTKPDTSTTAMAGNTGPSISR